MSARRRNHIPPYEILGRRGAEGFHPTIGTDSASKQGDIGDPPPSGSSWWAGSAGPIILRVPRGLAVIGLVVVIGLLVLAYFVGYSRGNASGAARVQQQFNGSSSVAMHPAPDVSPGQIVGLSSNGAGGSPAAAAGSSTPAPGRVGRQKGLNYLVLATYPHDWAKRLNQFMKTHGVETVLDRVQNTDKYRVVAVAQGFTASQLDSRRKDEYEAHLHQLGHVWRRFNGNRGDALETMFFAKYNGR